MRTSFGGRQSTIGAPEPTFAVTPSSSNAFFFASTISVCSLKTLSTFFSAVLDLAVSDYIEVYCRVNTASGTWGQYAGGIFQGFKIGA